MARICPAAREQLVRIRLELGPNEIQADECMRHLMNFLQGICGQTACNGNVCREIAPDMFFMQHGRHFVFLRKLASGESGVTAILHESVCPSAFVNCRHPRCQKFAE